MILSLRSIACPWDWTPGSPATQIRGRRTYTAEGAGHTVFGRWGSSMPKGDMRFSSPWSAQDRGVALAQYRQRASVYDSKLAVFDPLRGEAIERLALAPGATVLDAGCGTGLSFPLLQATVGPAGRITGIEQSSVMMEWAQCHVFEQGWSQVSLIGAPVEVAKLSWLFSQCLTYNGARLQVFPVALRPSIRCVRMSLRAYDEFHLGHAFPIGTAAALAWSCFAEVFSWCERAAGSR